jgi:hypothetical protein
MWEKFPIVGEFPSRVREVRGVNDTFPGMARSLNSFDQGREATRTAKGRKQMSVQSSLKRTLVAISAAIAMSSVAVGAAVGPAQAASAPSTVATNA